jgi:hypothetical protein
MKGWVCHLPKSQSAVISLFSVCTIYILLVINCMNMQHIQELCQSRLSTAYHALSLVAMFPFSRHSLCTDTTENIVPLLMWVTWYHVFHCSVTFCLAPDLMATLLPAAFLMLHDINAVVETILLSCSLAVAVFLALLLHLSDVMS